MNFLFNTSCYKPAYKAGGPLHSVSSLAEGIVNRGHSVTVAAPNRDLGERLDVDLNQNYTINGVNVRFFGTNRTLLQRTGVEYFARAGVYRLGKEFHSWLDKIGPDIDVFHSHMTFNPTNIPISRYAFVNQKVYLYHQRGNLDPVRLNIGKIKKLAYIHLYEKRVMRRADSLLALTDYERESFKRLALTNRVDVIPNGIDPDFSNTNPKILTPKVYQTLNCCGEEPLFFWMSRIHATKGPEIFVESAINAIKQGQQFHAVLSGPDEAGIEGNLQQLVADAGVSDRIHFTGAVGSDDRVALLNRADAFVLPTLSEGFSMVILEALASGCAILTSPGAHFDEIERVGAGRIIPRSVEAYTNGLIQFLKIGRNGLQAFGEKGKRFVHKNYAWDAIVEKYLSIASELIQTKRA